ncbi:MAG: ABC transporter ATP-binding protein [Zoogloeaceae bacterium]|nr:ABC transporter ATP-binding protein [Zoogloeaceae bacterium]
MSTCGHIRLSGVGVRFTQKRLVTQAVSDVSLEISPGEFVTLLGPSGCGKSTLLNVIAGFVAPTEGSVTMDGVPIVEPHAERCVVFQQYSLFPWLNVRENVEFGLRMKGVPAQKRQQTAREFLRITGLSAFECHYPEQLSGGMKQRVGIARALANNPSVLLLDEPFGALDAQTRVVLQEVLTNIWQRFRISVLFITHDISEAIFLSDRVYVMTAQPGKIKAEVPIPLARPRCDASFEEAGFREIQNHLRHLIREESLRAIGGADIPDLRDDRLANPDPISTTGA